MDLDIDGIETHVPTRNFGTEKKKKWKHPEGLGTRKNRRKRERTTLYGEDVDDFIKWRAKVRKE